MKYTLTEGCSYRRLLLSLGALLAVAAVAGCGDAGAPKAQVKGKVTYDGKPVTGGSLTFSPVASGEKGKGPGAKPAMANVQSDGTFVARTDKDADGAAIGKHQLSYSAPTVASDAPEWNGKGAPPETPKSEFAGLMPKEKEVEVKAGDNELNVELVKSGKK